MKVYIVTESHYPGIYIRHVFLDKEKAEQYAKIADRELESEGVMVKEYTVSDFDEIKVQTLLECMCRVIKNCNGTESIDFKWRITTINSLDHDLSINREYTWCCFYGRDEKRRSPYTICDLEMQRIIPQPNYNENQLEDKYRKICQDLIAQIEYYKSQGWTDDMVNEWLGNKTK